MRHTGRGRATWPMLTLVTGLVLAGLTACGEEQEAPPAEETVAPSPSQDAALIENGRAIVEMQCATCHAIGVEDDSPRSDTPPLRTVLADYDPDALADDFREGIHVGHPDMPDFNLGPKGTDSVLAYLVSIQERDGEG